jgi:Fe-S oxidoreductase
MKEMNTDAILNSGVKHIITADPHAYNALKNDYQGPAAGRAHQPVHRPQCQNPAPSG